MAEPMIAEPVVVVIENPQDDPDVIYGPGVTVIELSTYPMSKWCPPEELVDYGQEYALTIARARDHFSAGSEQWNSLNQMLVEYLERLGQAEVEAGG